MNPELDCGENEGCLDRQDKQLSSRDHQVPYHRHVRDHKISCRQGHQDCPDRLVPPVRTGLITRFQEQEVNLCSLVT